MSSKPIDIGSRKQLFLDELFFARRRDVFLVMNNPVQEKEPVIVPDRPWESGGVGGYNTVMREGETFRMWYDSFLKIGEHGAMDRRLCYAESSDGVHWTKPSLGLLEFRGSKRNNMVSPPGGEQSQQGATVFRDDRAPESERYKAWTKLNPAGRGVKRPRPGGLRALVSPDGFRWEFLEEGYPLGKGSAADTQSVPFWDDELGIYVAYVRIKKFPRGRARTCTVGRMTSKDFRNWTMAKKVFGADKIDEAMPLPAGMKALQPVLDFYTPAGMKYPGAPASYIMLPLAYHHWDAERYPSTIDVLLLTSRDGIKWYRPLERLPFLRHGMDGSASSGMLFANPWPIIVGDEVWIYYSGMGVNHKENISDRSQTGIYRARLRLDGFISADAPYGGGEFTTPPLMIQGQRLEVNIDTSGGGWAQVEVQGATGRSLEGFSQRDCDVVRGNSTRKTVTWGGSSDCSSLAGKPVCLRFVMHSARLYAFQFRED